MCLLAACFATASPAKAEGETTLCEAEEDPCAAEHLYPEATSIEAEASNPLLLTAYFTIYCEQSTARLGTTSASATPLEAEVEELQFSNCHYDKGSVECSFVVETPGTITVLRTGSEYTGDVALLGETARLKCTFLINCWLSLSISQEEEGLKLLSTTEKPAELRAHEALFEGLGVCPQLWKLDADYVIGSPAPLYVSG